MKNIEHKIYLIEKLLFLHYSEIATLPRKQRKELEEQLAVAKNTVIKDIQQNIIKELEELDK